MNVFGQVYSTDTLSNNIPSVVKEFGIQQMFLLFKHIGLNWENDPDFFKFFNSLWEYNFYPKNRCIVKKGEVSRKVFFIVSGSVMYYPEDQTVEDKQVHLLLNQGNFAGVFLSIKNGLPSIVNVETCSKTFVLEMSEYNIQRFVSEYREKAITLVEAITDLHGLYVHHLMVLLRLRSDERLESLKELNPELFLTVHAKYIASLLNLKNETYSRIKKVVDNR